ncbi:MAG TPA: extracellular solute-binding protein [Vicinamibacterales bacterium]|nr:extracellular solute-binding protein [Vicinamibacterales bacterium]
MTDFFEDNADGTNLRLSRRELLVKGGVAAGALGAGSLLAQRALAAQASVGEASQLTIRHLGYGVDQLAAIEAAAEKKLNYKFNFTIKDLPSVAQLLVTSPGQWDVASPDQYQVPQILPADVIQPIDTRRIPEWRNVVPLFKTGKMSASCTFGQGDAAYRMLPIDPKDPRRLTGGTPFQASLRNKVPQSRYIFGLPNVYNVDSFGYNRKVFGRPATTWAELVNPRWKGRIGIINDPASGPQELALALQSAGKLKVRNLGNMSRAEIDNLTKMTIDLKKQGYFRALWSTFEESASLMAAGEVVIESMWQPAQTILLEQGHDVGYAAPKEGYLGWCIFLAIPKHVKGEKLDAVYDYLNWWLSGVPGAIVARQGYYSPVPKNVRKYLSKAEWDYWYGGKPAATVLVGPSGKRLLPKGTLREGGSFARRVCKYAFWQTVMPETQYMTQRWNDFVSA